MCDAPNKFENLIHKFEAANLGRAPFRIVGVSIRKGPMPVLDAKGNRIPGMTVGSPWQPMGMCDYCGECLVECWIVADADGKKFIVGSTCAEKVGDEGLRKGMAPHKRRIKHERDDKRIAAAVELLWEDAQVRDALKAQGHPDGREFETLLDWCEFQVGNAGRSGKVKAARKIEAAAKGITS